MSVSFRQSFNGGHCHLFPIFFVPVLPFGPTRAAAVSNPAALPIKEYTIQSTRPDRRVFLALQGRTVVGNRSDQLPDEECRV